MQVLLISVQSATGPVAKLWREAIRSCLVDALRTVPDVLGGMRSASLEDPSNWTRVSAVCGALIVCGADLRLLRTGSQVLLSGASQPASKADTAQG